MKTIPTTVSWSGKIQYRFPYRDEERSTSEVDAYRFPFSVGTFWITFRVGIFYANGALRAEPVRMRLLVRTADGVSHDLISWRLYPPHQWWSTRWPIPSLPCLQEMGVWLEVERGEEREGEGERLIRVELQGFEGMYEGSSHYVLIDEEDRHRFLFQQQETVRKEKVVVGSIHDLFDEDFPATHGVSPLEVNGVPLFPLGARMKRVEH